MEATKRTWKNHPLESAGFLARLTFWWVFKIFVSDYKEKIKADNIWGPYHAHRSQIVGDKLEKEWKEELKKKKASITKQPSLMMALIRTFRREIAWLGLLSITQASVDALVRPQLLSMMLSYFSSAERANVTIALYGGCGLLLSTFTTNLLTNHMMLAAFTLGMKARAACVSLVYRKCLRLSKSAMSEISPGQVVNLVSNDVSRFDLVALSMNYLWTAPLMSIFIAYFLFTKVGNAGFAGMGLILFVTCIQYFTARLTAHFRMKIAYRTDERIRLTDEVLAGIQVIKLFAWEKPFIQLLEEARRRELNIVKWANYLRGWYMSFGLTTRRLAMLFTLLTYALCVQKNLSADVVFVTSSYFATLSTTMTGIFVRGVAEVTECLVSIKRLQIFLLRDEVLMVADDDIKEKDREDIIKSDDEMAVVVTNMNAAWDLSSSVPTLTNINFTVKKGTLVGVIGSVGSGKSSLLHLLMKEMKTVDGTIQVNGEISYSSQEPWIFAGTVRDNILLGLQYERRRYREIVRVCSLERDLELFPNGDMTMVGERGAALSGGQKARINLARAVYKEADMYLLDDPLSAVDPHVSNSIFHECIRGYLKDKTVVLATHQLQVIKDVDHIIMLQAGQIEDQGSYKEFTEHGHEFTQHVAYEVPEPPNPKKNYSRMLSTLSTRSLVVGDEISIISNYDDEEEIKEVTTEEYTTYKGNKYCGYIRCGYGVGFFVFYFMFLAMAQTLASACDIWIRNWTISEEADPSNGTERSMETEGANENQEVRNYNLIVLASLVVALFIAAIVRGQIFFTLCASCSRGMHTLLTRSVLFTSMSFFNNVPSGAVLNRFSKDLGSTDELLPKSVLDSSQIFGQVIGAIITTLIVNFYLLIPVSIFGVIMLIVRRYYMRTSLNLKRLENMNRSPVFTHLNTTMQGLTTVRAHGSQQYLTKEFDLHQDLHTTTLFTFLSAQQGYSFTLDIMGLIYLSLVVFSFILFSNGVHGADVGLAISQTMVITQMLQWGMRQFSEFVNLMTSVERLLAFINLPAEETDTDKKSLPPTPWPYQGEITFRNVSLTYEKDKSSVINNISLHIQPGEKVGIVGRTGAGKSSLTAALFRTAIVDGDIVIDNVNTADISLYTLRNRISIIPQNPVLFSGNLRRNLDPFNEHPDYILWRALDELDLQEVFKEGRGLETKISDGGSNLSTGQRQLVCLARAVIRDSKITVLDEATASVDPETDALIQKIIRSKFKKCTVLTIAHRMNTVMDSDRILVMDAGSIVEFDIPHLLMKSDSGYLYNMVQETGSTMAAQLAAQAEQCYLRRQQESLQE